MKNTLTDMNNYLFEQLEILNDIETLYSSDETFEKIIKLNKAKEEVCEQIISLNKLRMEQAKLVAEYGGYDKAEKLMIGMENK